MTLLAAHPNPAVGGVSGSLNSQPSPHFDTKDVSVIVADVVHTNALGGEFLIYEVGLAIACENGSQVVWQFNVLLHGVGNTSSDELLWLPLEDDQSNLTDKQIKQKALDLVKAYHKDFKRLLPDESASTSKHCNERAKAFAAQDPVANKNFNAKQKKKAKAE
ncbi:hypothetical protein DFH28DRAFT_928192 [Melampsora americana]|nr:hypothetical protein DFH28DRAFT_928192 [Melampsora americana]